MNDSKEICLYFEKGTTYNQLEVATEIQERFPDIGNPLIVPKSNKEVPVLMYQDNPQFFLRCNFDILNFVVDHSYFKKLETMIFDLVDVFEEHGVKFVRIGYVANIYLDKKNVSKYRKEYLKEDRTKDMEEFQLFLFKELETKYGNINSWERVLSEGNSKHDVLLQYDFNSKQEDVIDFDMKYIKEFVKVANDYIESRTI